MTETFELVDLSVFLSGEPLCQDDHMMFHNGEPKKTPVKDCPCLVTAEVVRVRTCNNEQTLWCRNIYEAMSGNPKMACRACGLPINHCWTYREL